MIDALVLHIGTHKTGTSSIQGSLGASYEGLLARAVLYPQTGRLRRRPQHANLAREVVGDDAFDPALGDTEALVEEVAATDPRAVILSSEAFTRHPLRREPAEWALELCERLGASRVHVIAYVRPQWDYLESSYSYRVRRGFEGADFAAYVEGRLNDPQLDYRTRFRTWDEAFGERLSVRAYGAAALAGRDIVDDFWAAVEWLPAEPIARVHDHNQRPGARTTGMLLRVAQALAERGLTEPDLLGPAFSEARHTLRMELGEDPSPYRGLTPEIAARVHRHFLESNRAIVRRFGPAHDQLVEPPRVAEQPETWTLDNATESELRLLERLLANASATASAVRGGAERSDASSQRPSAPSRSPRFRRRLARRRGG